MTIKDFVDQKIAIAFKNTEQVREFAKLCGDLKMYRTGTNAREWMEFNPETLFNGLWKYKFVHFAYAFKERGCPDGLSWSGNDTLEDCHYTDVGWKIVTFEEFAGKKTFPKHEIVITCEDNTTRALLKVDGKIIREATARRNPNDEFNFNTGATLAFARLLSKEEKQDTKEVKRHAKPGEWVKVVNAAEDAANDYRNGDILQIVQAKRNKYGLPEGCAAYKDEIAKWLYDREYIVLENYKKPAMGDEDAPGQTDGCVGCKYEDKTELFCRKKLDCSGTYVRAEKEKHANRFVPKK